MLTQGELAKLLRQSAHKAPADYAGLRIQRLPANRSSIAYYEFGDPDGFPLLCLHGLSLSGLCFEQYHQRSIALGVRAIAPCLLGGIYLAEDRDSADTLTSRLLELLDLLHIGKCDMIGFSWGTLVQLSLLARAPGRIRKAGLFGTMLPTAFWPDGLADQLKPDVRMTMQMVRRMPRVHRCLMWLVSCLPVAGLVGQFRDPGLSESEQTALQPGTAFYASLVRYMRECMRTGSRFFTDGWRMFQDQPVYTLAQLRTGSVGADVRFYVAERDNVHLPQFSVLAAAALTGIDASLISAKLAPAWPTPPDAGSGQLQELRLQANCSLWLLGGAGRMACMVHFEQALNNLIAQENSPKVTAQGAAAVLY
jgi:pimeloyl-ACP methyl ester carboxylesterase